MRRLLYCCLPSAQEVGIRVPFHTSSRRRLGSSLRVRRLLPFGSSTGPIHSSLASCLHGCELEQGIPASVAPLRLLLLLKVARLGRGEPQLRADLGREQHLHVLLQLFEVGSCQLGHRPLDRSRNVGCLLRRFPVPPHDLQLPRWSAFLRDSSIRLGRDQRLLLARSLCYRHSCERRRYSIGCRASLLGFYDDLWGPILRLCCDAHLVWAIDSSCLRFDSTKCGYWSDYWRLNHHTGNPHLYHTHSFVLPDHCSHFCFLDQ